MVTVNGKPYYLDPSDGKMKVSTPFVVDGVSYDSDANGVCTQTPAEVPNETDPTSGTQPDAPVRKSNKCKYKNAIGDQSYQRNRHLVYTK